MASTRGRHHSPTTQPAPAHPRCRRRRGSEVASARSSGEGWGNQASEGRFQASTGRKNRPQGPRPANASLSDRVRVALLRSPTLPPRTMMSPLPQVPPPPTPSRRRRGTLTFACHPHQPPLPTSSPSAPNPLGTQNPPFPHPPFPRPSAPLAAGPLHSHAPPSVGDPVPLPPEASRPQHPYPPTPPA